MSSTSRAFALGVASLLLAVPVFWTQGAVSASTNHGAIVVQHGNPTAAGTDCVAFTQSQISGFKALDASRFDFRAAHFDAGHTICWIDGEGCKTTSTKDCFCDPVNSWSLWVQKKSDSAPSPSSTGVDDAAFADGTVQYWVWGPFGVPPVQPTTASSVCANAAGPPAGTSKPASPAVSHARTPGTDVAGIRIPLPATR